MSRTFLGELPIFLLLIISGLVGKTFSDVLPLSDGCSYQVRLTNIHETVPFLQRISIPASSTVSYNITNVSSSVSFFIFQIHTYLYDVTLSFDKNHLNKISNSSVFGTNIGLYSVNTGNITNVLFVKNDNVHDVEALLVATAYNDQAPIPGGCNMEFNTKIAPYLKVQTQDTMIIVDMQPASISSNNSNSSCEKNNVEHEVYHMFLSHQDFSVESYFSAIESMLTIQSIMENGAKVDGSTVSSPMRRVFNAYTGVGSVYVAVATYGKHSAAYVPAFSYACDPLFEPESCKVLDGLFSMFVCGICFFIGVFSVFFGHLSIDINMVVPVFFIGTLIGYTIAGIGIGIVIGIVITIAWFSCQFFASLVHSLTFNLTLGTFFACVAYFCTSDSFVLLHNNWVFWLLFIFLVLAISLGSFVLSMFGHVIICAIFTSLMIILPLDYCFGSSLKYIFINIVRRATVRDFNLAVITPPIQTTDTVLVVIWIFLALYRLWKQSYGKYNPL